MKQWLIMECKELEDQWECDADRRPILITSNEKKMQSMRYGNEVYEINEDGSLTLIKRHDEDNKVDSGMALYYWDVDDSPNDSPYIIQKFPDRTREDPIPFQALVLLRTGEEMDNIGWLKSCGHVSSFIKNFKGHDEVLMYYGEYSGIHYSQD